MEFFSLVWSYYWLRLRLREDRRDSQISVRFPRLPRVNRDLRSSVVRSSHVTRPAGGARCLPAVFLDDGRSSRRLSASIIAAVRWLTAELYALAALIVAKSATAVGDDDDVVRNSLGVRRSELCGASTRRLRPPSRLIGCLLNRDVE